MSFTLLLQQQGVQLRSWHRMAPSRLLCRTCLLVRRQHQEQFYTKPSLVVFGSRNYSSGILGNGGHCRWNTLKLQQHPLSSTIQPPYQQRQLHLATPEKNTKVQELIKLLSHPPTHHRPSSSTSSPKSTHSSTTTERRLYRNKLAGLYESIRRDTDTWHILTSQQLWALYKVLRSSTNDTSTSNIFRSGQHILQDIQHRTPERFVISHVEALLSTYKLTGQVDEALNLVDWTNTTQTPLSLTAYEYLISILTTTTKTTLTTDKRHYQPMDLALHYWDQVKATTTSSSSTVSPLSKSMETKLDLMTGYMMQGFLAQGDLMQAASWLKTHTRPFNVDMQQILDQWKLATSMDGDDQYYAVGVVSYGLEKLIQQTSHLDRYADAQLFYQQQCRLFTSNNNTTDGDIEKSNFSGSMQQKQPLVGLLQLTHRCMTTNKVTVVQQLLQDSLDLGHHKGTKVLAHRLLHHYLTKSKLRQALDLYFWMDTLEQSQQLPRCYGMVESRALLLRSAQAKYHTDMYRLYQRFATLYPTSLDLRTYTHILQTLIRTKQYDEARVVYHDAIHNPHLLTATIPTGSSVSTSGYTKRLFHLAYSLCAQVGDLDLFKSTVTLQRKAGFPGLHHHALTSLMAAYVKVEDTGSAKAVFDHLAHRLEQQQRSPDVRQSTPMDSTASMDSMDDYGNDDHTVGGFDGEQEMVEHSDVDVVDFNLLMRTIKVEHDEYEKQHQQQQKEPIANQVLDILRHMDLVGVNLNSTTLQTLLDVYKGSGRMEDELYTTLSVDPKSTQHDDIWLNNRKLTYILDGDHTHATQIQRTKMAATVFLSNDRRLLFPDAPLDTPILADGMTYKILLDALTQHTQFAPMAQRIFDHMRNRGWRPSVVTYEQMVNVWARKTRLNKVLTVMQLARDDLGWVDVPIKWYTLVLDRLVAQGRLDLAKKWTLEIKKNKRLSMDRVLKERLIQYGLNDSSSSMATSHQHQ